MFVLFVGLILSLTAALVYVVNDALLPRSRAGLAAAAENLCTPDHPPSSRAWRECLRRQPRPPSEEAAPFLFGATGAALLGLALIVLAARARRTALIPAVLLGIIILAGSTYAVRLRDRDIDRLERIRSTEVPTPAAPTPPNDAR